LDNVLDIAVAHARVERQGDDALKLPVGYWELFGPEAVPLTIVRVRVDGDEVDAGSDAPLPHLLYEPFARTAQGFEIQAEHVEMPRVLDPGARDREVKLLESGEGFRVAAHDLDASRLKTVELA